MLHSAITLVHAGKYQTADKRTKTEHNPEKVGLLTIKKILIVNFVIIND